MFSVRVASRVERPARRKTVQEVRFQMFSYQ